MRTIYLTSVYLHLLAAMVWLGGMLFVVLVAVPALRRLDNDRTRAQLLAEVGRRFRNVGWVAITVLLVTGVVNAVGRWGSTTLLQPAFWGSDPGLHLAIKLGLVGLMLVLSALHDFVLGPRLTALGRADPADPRLPGLRRQTVWLARLELGLGLGVMWLAVRIVRP